MDEKVTNMKDKSKNMISVDYRDVTITGGFWKKRQSRNASVTSRAVYERFCESHRFEALDCRWKEGMCYEPHVYWDSDVAKWIEGAAYVIRKCDDTQLAEELKKRCENAIDMILENQTKEGYFNSHFLVMEQEQRFKERNNCELYNAGHLIEAACAYYEATGEDRFLQGMCRYADYIYDVFVVYQTAAFITSGHPEIELALIRLYQTTGNEKYYELCSFFMEKRGNNQKDTLLGSGFTKYTAQDHLPLKQQRTAEGHSVRAMYIYSAMADLAGLDQDEEYLEACEAIFENVINHRMYITGGIGSTNIGEAFATDHYLPNDAAYAETCAAISLAMFCKRMLQNTADSRYADTIERVIYNGFLSGVSLDGKSFFYENPLEIDPYFAQVNTSTVSKRHLPIMERVELFDCSCCPPNIFRFIGSIGEYLYTQDGDTLYVHQFMESEAVIAPKSGQGKDKITVKQYTDYPAKGNVRIVIEGNGRQQGWKQTAVRIPGWCSSFTADAPYEMRNGYAYFKGCSEIQICFDMTPQLYEADTRVQNNAGCVALMRGPVVYCLEAVDNGTQLKSLKLVSGAAVTEKEDDTYQVPVLITEGLRKKKGEGLYPVYRNTYEPARLTFIPYFAFANRGASEMIVWVQIRE